MKHPKLYRSAYKMHIHGSNGIHKRVQDLENGLGCHVPKKKKKPKSLAIRNFNTYLPTNFKTFQNRANPGSAFLKLKTNKSYYYQRDYVVIRMKT